MNPNFCDLNLIASSINFKDTLIEVDVATTSPHNSNSENEVKVPTALHPHDVTIDKTDTNDSDGTAEDTSGPLVVVPLN